MIHVSNSSRQPLQNAWTLERLNTELVINLRLAVDHSTHANYTSALNSYLTFCWLHNFDIDPTPRTLALYMTYQCSFINPKSVDTYLSGIWNQIETHFPSVWAAHQSTLVTHALQGTRCRFGVPTHRKLLLTHQNLLSVLGDHCTHHTHNSLLFTTLIFVGMECLMCLAKLVWPNTVALWDYRKVTMRHSVEHMGSVVSFLLPTHKANTI
jgi:hypothetical protein